MDCHFDIRRTVLCVLANKRKGVEALSDNNVYTDCALFIDFPTLDVTDLRSFFEAQYYVDSKQRCRSYVDVSAPIYYIYPKNCSEKASKQWQKYSRGSSAVLEVL
ncbi:uncharacterized protein [Montipora foliosa]|uniref:uncharacterized protein isoform X2 n=1 Tax=Montipora foliosa TaxID=591990 RepID=UPI0035F13E4B